MLIFWVTAGLPNGGTLTTPLDGAVWSALLGQIQVPPIEGVGQWMWHAMGALGILVLLLKGAALVRELFGRTPSLDHVLKGMATREDLDELHQDLDAMRKRIEDQDREWHAKLERHWHELNRARSENTKDLHDRIEAIHDTLRREMADMPQKVINLLQSTGALGKGGRN